MKKQEPHRVKTHIWRGGVLTVFEEFFESLEAAVGFSHRSSAHAVKIYHHDSGELVHSVSAITPESEQTYA